MSVFEVLNSLNVNEHTEIKKTDRVELTYLSWPWAWAEIKKKYEDAQYTIWKDEKGLPYSYDPQTGYMVYTTVTINGISHEMWLPVMDSANNAMKSVPYEIQTKYRTISVKAATMFDINKAIMRCLVKNLAMFGLGLYIYAGEDLPEGCEEPEKEPPKVRMPDIPKAEGPVQIDSGNALPFDAGREVRAYLVECGIGMDEFRQMYKGLVDGGCIKDIKQADMTKADVEALKNAMRLNFSGVCK